MHSTEFLLPVLVLLGSAVLIVAVFKRLALSPVLGYFVAGAAIGMHGLGIVSHEDTKVFAEFGVVFLLFAIGLELTFERLVAMRRQVFGLGLLQVVITSVTIGSIIYFIGDNMHPAIIIGGGLALSSTAIVLQVLAEHRKQSTQSGRLALAVLLMQDFAVVPLLVMVPFLAGEETNIAWSMGSALVKAILTLIIIFILGRLFLRPLFAIIGSARNAAQTNELFIATTLLIALGTAWGTENMGLSLALGAFVGGLLVAETEFQHQVEESITPFKGLFLGLFFMTVGMSIDPALMIDKLWLVMVLVVAIIVIKTIILTLLCLAFRFSLSNAIQTGLILSQGSEFAFILFGMTTELRILDNELGQVLLLVVTITMALTPLLSRLGDWVAHKLDSVHHLAKDDHIHQEVADIENHVIIAGFGRVGKMVAHILEAEHIPYIATDTDMIIVQEAQKAGYPVYRGDAARLEMLKSMGAMRCRAIILTVCNDVTIKKATRTIQKNFPKASVIVRAKDLTNAYALEDAGASIIVPEVYETGLQLGAAVLQSVGISDYEISRLKNYFRDANYIFAKELHRAQDSDQSNSS